MADLEILHFEQLKNEIQARFLENHTPSFDEISKWKGIDIIYFQEDLRKIAKGNISEKSFYTYFKTSPVAKLPRIDMLNLLSAYCGYQSWYDFKKNHLFKGEVLSEYENAITETSLTDPISLEVENKESKQEISLKTDKIVTVDNGVLQNNTNDNQLVEDFSKNNSSYKKKSFVKKLADSLWYIISGFLAILVALLGFRDDLFSRKYYYSFIDADRNSKINAELQVQILKKDESPILHTAKPNEPFVYTTKSKSLIMVVSSPYYRTDTIIRNLETAPETENIELKRNEYAWMLYFYSRSIIDLKRKRESLNRIIDDNALIYQIFDSDDYGMETMDKQRYISLVTLPTTSLEKLEVIDTRNDKNGKINMIKFRIKK